mgnify:CR=1 FL=1
MQKAYAAGGGEGAVDVWDGALAGARAGRREGRTEEDERVTTGALGEEIGRAHV